MGSSARGGSEGLFEIFWKRGNLGGGAELQDGKEESNDKGHQEEEEGGSNMLQCEGRSFISK